MYNSKNLLLLGLSSILTLFSFAQIPTCPKDGFGGNENVNISALNPQIHTNTSSGEGPLYIYASAYQSTATNSTSPFYDVEYTWDFGDTSSTSGFTLAHPVDATIMEAEKDQMGPEAAYLYKSPGTYTITLTARAWNGVNYISNTTTTTIVVSQWTGQDKYFDPVNGNDLNSGDSPSAPWQTWSAMTTWLDGANNRQAILKKGEVMIATSTFITKKSNLRITAYGVGANPIILAGAGMTNNHIIYVNGTNANINNHYYSDIDIDLNNLAGSAFFGYSDPTGALNNVAFNNCNFSNGSTQSIILTTGSGPKQSFLLWNCDFNANNGEKQNFVPYNTPYCAVLGGTQIGGNGHPILDHHMYINHCDHTLIRWISFGTSATRNFCLNMNSPSYSDDFEYTLIDGCNITGTNNGIDFSNSNNDNTGHFSKTIVQNCAIHDFNSGSQGMGVFGYSIKDICVRSNRFYDNKQADINILDSDNIYSVYKNSFYDYQSFPHPAISIVTGQQGTFYKNIFNSDATSGSSYFSGDLGTTANWTIDNNEYWHPNMNTPFYESSVGAALTFAQWQALGYDVNGLEQNPYFPNPLQGNFGELPLADFTFSANGSLVNFTDNSFLNPSVGWLTTYNWNFGDNQTSIQQNPTHSYAATGNFTVQMNVHNLCGTDSISKIVAIGNLSFQGLESAMIKAYPNPTSGITIIEMDGIIQFAIYDLNGVQILNHEVEKTNAIQLDLTDFATGIYVLEVQTNTKKSALRITKL